MAHPPTTQSWGAAAKKKKRVNDDYIRLCLVVAMAFVPLACTVGRPPATPGAQVQQALSRAVSAGSPSFTLPAGDIAFGKAVFSLQAARDFVLQGSATGTTTLVFAPGGGMRVAGCSNVTVRDVPLFKTGTPTPL
eukprot:SAG31_NODE_677_length_12894_cov_4.083548_9_plen_135_part_00